MAGDDNSRRRVLLQLAASMAEGQVASTSQDGVQIQDEAAVMLQAMQKNEDEVQQAILQTLSLDGSKEPLKEAMLASLALLEKPASNEVEQSGSQATLQL